MQYSDDEMPMTRRRFESPLSSFSYTNHPSTRHKASGKIENLEEIIVFRREELSLCPPGNSQRDIPLNHLAHCLSARYKELGRMTDLDEAISLLREALSLRPRGNLNRESSLNNLARCLSTRYEVLGEINDLKESVSIQREALSLCPPGHADRALYLDNLARILSTRYEVLGEIEDLEESISLNRKTLSLLSPGDHNYALFLNNIAAVLYTCHRISGKIEDLEDSISFQRQSLSLCPPSPSNTNHALFLGNLANGLSTRYEVLGNMGDLEESIAFHRQVLNLCPPGNSNHAFSLNNLGASCLSLRYKILKNIEDLEDSILFHRRALNLRPPGHIKCALTLNNLARCLFTRYNVLGKTEDLKESISFQRRVLSLCPSGNRHRASSLSNLAVCLSTRYNLLGKTAKIKDLKESISFHREALSLRPCGHPERSLSLANLATVLCYYHRHFGSVCTVKDSRLEDVFVLYRQAAFDGTSMVQSRLSACLHWINAGRYFQHESLLSAYATALCLVNQCLVLRSSVESQQSFLATAKIPTRSLASKAASAAIKAGNVELAVEFLEQGRAMLWSRVDGYKYPFQELQAVEGGEELAARLQTLGAELEHLAFSSHKLEEATSESSTDISADTRMKRHRLLSEEWEDLVGRIRKMEGFSHFLQAPQFRTLQFAAAEGPVILVNISKYRSDAIILVKDKPPALVNLPEVRLQELRAQRLGTAREIKQTQSYLWDKIVSPIVECLAELGIPKKSRIWWCPTAELCALPLHAAGRGKRNLQDIYVSSYTSTLSSLIRARSQANKVSSSMDHTTPKLLVVGEPSKTQVLKNVKDEVDTIKALRPDNSTVNVLFGPSAVPEAVINALKEHSWVHFACHGRLGDNDQPFRASFELHDARHLPVLDLIRAKLPNAELAFLSACHSAAGGPKTPDESIHLSAALQFCGFRSVVGTLWEMDDTDGPMISELFYKYMFRNPDRVDFRDSAHALNYAITTMRKVKVPPERWVMFVHTGA